MKTRVKNIKETQGFRRVFKAYFDYIFADQDIKGKKKQKSPFILFREGTVKAIWTVDELIEETDDRDYYYTVLQAWPGQKRTDVFQFDMADLDDYMEMVWAPKALAEDLKKRSEAGDKEATKLLKSIRKPNNLWRPPLVI